MQKYNYFFLININSLIKNIIHKTHGANTVHFIFMLDVLTVT